MQEIRICIITSCTFWEHSRYDFLKRSCDVKKQQIKSFFSKSLLKSHLLSNTFPGHIVQICTVPPSCSPRRSPPSSITLCKLLFYWVVCAVPGIKDVPLRGLCDDWRARDWRVSGSIWARSFQACLDGAGYIRALP